MYAAFKARHTRHNSFTPVPFHECTENAWIKWKELLWPATNVRVNTWVQRQTAAITRSPCSWPPYTESWTRLLLYIRVASVHSPMCTRAHKGASDGGDLTETRLISPSRRQRLLTCVWLPWANPLNMQCFNWQGANATKKVVCYMERVLYVEARYEMWGSLHCVTAEVPTKIPRKVLKSQGHQITNTCKNKLKQNCWKRRTRNVDTVSNCLEKHSLCVGAWPSRQELSNHGNSFNHWTKCI